MEGSIPSPRRACKSGDFVRSMKGSPGLRCQSMSRICPEHPVLFGPTAIGTAATDASLLLLARCSGRPAVGEAAAFRVGGHRRLTARSTRFRKRAVRLDRDGSASALRPDSHRARRVRDHAYRHACRCTKAGPAVSAQQRDAVTRRPGKGEALRVLRGRTLRRIVALATASSCYAAARARARAWRRYRPGASPRRRANARENEYSER